MIVGAPMPMPLMAMAGPPPREALRLGAPASMPVLRHKFPETWIYATQTAFVAYSLDTTISSSIFISSFYAKTLLDSIRLFVVTNIFE